MYLGWQRTFQISLNIYVNLQNNQDTENEEKTMCLILVWALGAPPIDQIEKFWILNCCLPPLYINNWMKGILSQGFKLVHVSLCENFIPAHYFVVQAINTIRIYPNRPQSTYYLIWCIFIAGTFAQRSCLLRWMRRDFCVNIHKSKQS